MTSGCVPCSCFFPGLKNEGDRELLYQNFPVVAFEENPPQICHQEMQNDPTPASPQGDPSGLGPDHPPPFPGGARNMVSRGCPGQKCGEGHRDQVFENLQSDLRSSQTQLGSQSDQQVGFENLGAVRSSDQSQILKDLSSFVSSSSQLVGDQATGILFQSDQASESLKSDPRGCVERGESESMAASQGSDLSDPAPSSQDPNAEFRPEGD